MKILKNLFITRNFFLYITGIIFLYIIGYFFLPVYLIAQISLITLFTVSVIDIFILFRFKNAIEAERVLADRLSNGDINPVSINMFNNYPFPVSLEIIDEIPHQFQKRDFLKKQAIKEKSGISITYFLRPVQRGEYTFGSLNIYASSKLNLFKRRFRFERNKSVPVYPSYLQLHKYELIAISRNLTEMGIKQIRKLGHSLEFEQIRKYIPGDDTRAINWKATARRQDLMVNQYQDERAQNVYFIIDMGRVMKMPFEGLSLLDYAINTTLVMSSVSLKKYDKPGLLTFNNEISFFLKSDHKKLQMQKIVDALYKQQTNFLEPNYPLLHNFVRTNIRHRSLIFLFTNFETLSGMQRYIRELHSISKNHLLVVVFFKNTELNSLLESEAKDVKDVYRKVIAEKMSYEKRQIVKELNKQGILTIYTEPQNLTVDAINKYLEIKAKRMI